MYNFSIYLSHRHFFYLLFLKESKKAKLLYESEVISTNVLLINSVSIKFSAFL